MLKTIQGVGSIHAQEKFSRKSRHSVWRLVGSLLAPLFCYISLAPLVSLLGIFMAATFSMVAHNFHCRAHDSNYQVDPPYLRQIPPFWIYNWSKKVEQMQHQAKRTANPLLPVAEAFLHISSTRNCDT